MYQTQMAHLRVDHIDFAYENGQTVFRDFSLEAKPGEFVALLGPSGCGKSTLLNLLSGFLQPQQGHIAVNDIPVRPEMAELGYVFQSPQLFPWLNALDNVAFGLRMRAGVSRIEREHKAREALALVGLADAAQRLPHQLSGGMQQRISLARTLAMEPTLLLMDEPFAALDAISRLSMNEELLRLWSKLGQTVVFITHDIDEAVFLADRVVVLGKAPLGVRRSVEIELPRPRIHRETRRLPQFHEYSSDLMDAISTPSAAAPAVTPASSPLLFESTL
ncbi:Taurine import ATP-binding protein TauB [compost metagenome]